MRQIDKEGGRILAQRAGLQTVHGIPLRRVLAFNEARTIPRERYDEEGAIDRFGYVKNLAEDYGTPLDVALEIADMLGPEEDFDGLVTSLEDYEDFC